MRDLQPVEGVSPGDVISQVVAAELWIQVRSFAWRRLTKVAALIVTDTKIGALRELGHVADRNDCTWALTHPVEVLARGDFSGLGVAFTKGYRGATCGELAGCRETDLLTSKAEEGQSADVELFEVLEWALARDVISAEDRYLLLCLVEEAEQCSERLIDRGEFGGLLATKLSQRVGDRVGLREAGCTLPVAGCRDAATTFDLNAPARSSPARTPSRTPRRPTCPRCDGSKKRGKSRPA